MSGIYYDVIRMSLGAMSSDTATAATTKCDTTRLQGFRVLRTEWFAQWDDFTAGEGPVVWGFCGDLTAAEVAEVFLADPQRANDTNLAEQAERPLWIQDIYSDIGDSYCISKGVWKPNWSFPEGTPLKAFAFNPNSEAITTGSTMLIVAKHFGVWLKD